MSLDLSSGALAHLAIAVEDLKSAAEIYRTLGFTLAEPEIVAAERVRLQLATKDGLRIELLEAHPAGQGPIAKFLAKRGPGLHHVALRTEDLTAELAKLAAQGIRPLKGYPTDGAAGTKVAFLDPKCTGGVLIEIVEKPLQP